MLYPNLSMKCLYTADQFAGLDLDRLRRDRAGQHDVLIVNAGANGDEVTGHLIENLAAAAASPDHPAGTGQAPQTEFL